MSDLNIVEATALAKLVEKQLKQLKDAGETVAPGNYTFNFDVHLDGSLSRGEDTKATPPFAIAGFLKPLLLKYAMGLGKEEGKQWLQNLMSVQAALGAVIQLGAESVMQSIDPSFTALWAAAEASAKEKFQSVAEKADRAGQTIVVGGLEKAVEEVKIPKIVKSAKKK